MLVNCVWECTAYSLLLLLLLFFAFTTASFLLALQMLWFRGIPEEEYLQEKISKMMWGNYHFSFTPPVLLEFIWDCAHCQGGPFHRRRIPILENLQSKPRRARRLRGREVHARGVPGKPSCPVSRERCPSLPQLPWGTRGPAEVCSRAVCAQASRSSSHPRTLPGLRCCGRVRQHSLQLQESSGLQVSGFCT